MGLFDGFPGQQMGNYAAPLMQGQAQQQTASPMDGTNLGSALTQLQQMPMGYNGLPQIMQPAQPAQPGIPPQREGPAVPVGPVAPAPGSVGTTGVGLGTGVTANSGVGLGTGTFATNGTAPSQPTAPPEMAIGGTFGRPIFPRA